MARNVVGARELKVRLGTYLRQVREGRTLVVTDRGQPVAELRPVGSATGVEAVLARLETAGLVRRPTRKLGPSFRPAARGALAAAVIDERKDRL